MDKGSEGRRWHYVHNTLCSNLCYLWIKVVNEEDETMYIIYTLHKPLLSMGKGIEGRKWNYIVWDTILETSWKYDLYRDEMGFIHVLLSNCVICSALHNWNHRFCKTDN